MTTALDAALQIVGKCGHVFLALRVGLIAKVLALRRHLLRLDGDIAQRLVGFNHTADPIAALDFKFYRSVTRRERIQGANDPHQRLDHIAVRKKLHANLSDDRARDSAADW